MRGCTGTGLRPGARMEHQAKAGLSCELRSETSSADCSPQVVAEHVAPHISTESTPSQVAHAS